MKLVVREPESDVAVDLWNAASSLASSRLSIVEVRSAVARAHRGGRIAPRALRDVRARLEQLGRSVEWVEPTPRLVEAAAAAAERYELRAYDAVHLASAIALDDAALVLATWDADLRRAGQAAGVAVAP